MDEHSRMHQSLKEGARDPADLIRAGLARIAEFEPSLFAGEAAVLTLKCCKCRVCLPFLHFHVSF